MYGLDTIHEMNNESGETLDGKAQTLAEIQEAARQEKILDEMHAEDWPEPRNEH